jgi:hypothetical protein
MRSTQTGQWRDLVFGPGTDYPVTEIIGVDDMAEIRTADIPRPQSDGDWSGTDQVAPRVVIMTLGIRGTSGPDLEAKRKAAMFELSPSRRNTERLVLTDGRQVYAKLRRYAMPTDMGNDWRIGELHLEFYCPDPRVYTGDLQAKTLIAGAGRLSGRTYKRGYTAASGAPNYVAPAGWQYPPASQVVSEAQFTNTGNVPAPLDCLLRGVLLNPRIEVVGVSQFPLTVSLGATDQLRITHDYHLLLNGVERRDLLGIGAVWPAVPPGTWTVRLFAQSGSGTADILMQSANL